MRDADFQRPGAARPWPVRIATALGRPLAGRVDLSAEAIVRRALRGLPEGAEADIRFRDALEALCHSMAHETDMHAVGRLAARGDTVRLLRTQIRVNRALAAEPAIGETPLPRPIFVIGWPRTGTTILHTLLAQDPAHRALLYYEGFDPAAGAGDVATRKAALGRMLAGLEYMAPGYRAIHAMDPDSVEECVTVMLHTFTTPQFEFQYHCPSYLAWLERTGPRASYRHYREQLRMLQYHRPAGERFVLKDPAHLLALDHLLELFPDALFVWTHRDPVRALGSIASLTAHTRALFSDAYDAETVGRQVLSGIWPRALRRGLALREKLPPDRIADVRYADFLREPIGTIGGIYARFGLPFGFEARRAMERHLAAHPQGSEGRHRYSPERFAIDPATEAERYRDYVERFAIEREAA